MRLVFGLTIGVLALSINSISSAKVVDKSAFSPAATVEGFESVTHGQNLSVAAPYEFASGVTLTSPGPGGYGSFGPYLVGGGFFGLYGGQDVPDGYAYFGQANPHDFTMPSNSRSRLRFCVLALTSVRWTRPTPTNLVRSILKHLM